MICTGRGHKVHYSWGMQPPQDRTQGADLPFTHPQWPTNTHVHTHTSASEQFQLAMWSLISSRHTELWCDAFILCGPFSMAPLCCPPSFLSSADSHSLPFLRFWSWNKPSAMTHVHACVCVCVGGVLCTHVPGRIVVWTCKSTWKVPSWCKVSWKKHNYGVSK